MVQIQTYYYGTHTSHKALAIVVDWARMVDGAQNVEEKVRLLDQGAMMKGALTEYLHRGYQEREVLTFLHPCPGRAQRCTGKGEVVDG